MRWQLVLYTWGSYYSNGGRNFFSERDLLLTLTSLKKGRRILNYVLEAKEVIYKYLGSTFFLH
ncbi:MAG: hypothetical protein DRN04_00900 [Thermoprotei archaeon]|nr:MAG: hypothetical protein DRN04_00900 [Thermoprotei archaeon]